MSRGNEKSVLIAVDLQNDFCPGGAMGVAQGNEIIKGINLVARHFREIILTQDWHPANHFSFSKNHPGKRAYEEVQCPYGPQILWPEHCIQESIGAQFHSAVNIPHASLILRKGRHPAIDSYSAFFENDQKTPTGLHGYLQNIKIDQLYLAGLATDFCVLYSALHGKQLGYKTFVFLDLCRGIDRQNSVAQAIDTMKNSGIVLLDSKEF
jgi:nicotinamidase-related amidase